MHETAQSMTAADLVIHGTFDLRRSLDRYAQPVRHAAPPRRPGLSRSRRTAQDNPNCCPTRGSIVALVHKPADALLGPQCRVAGQLR